jgi:hypothetical protein
MRVELAPFPSPQDGGPRGEVERLVWLEMGGPAPSQTVRRSAYERWLEAVRRVQPGFDPWGHREAA